MFSKIHSGYIFTVTEVQVKRDGSTRLKKYCFTLQ